MATLEIFQTIDAPVRQMWSACATTNGLANWQADNVDGDCNEGGTITLHWPVLGASASIGIETYQPNQEISFRQGDSLVRLRFSPEGVYFSQNNVSESGDLPGLTASWAMALAQLGHFVERHPGRARRVSWHLVTAPCSAESAYLAFTEASLLCQWLTSRGQVPAAGAFTLELQNDSRITGRVLANIQGHDVALGLDSTGEPTLVLRTLPSPRSSRERSIAIISSEWGPPHDDSRKLFQQIGQALPALAKLLASSGQLEPGLS